MANTQNQQTPRKLLFTREEDELLKKAVEVYGIYNWDEVSKQIKGRSRRQCRDRWTKFLSPQLNLSSWTKEEDDLLIAKYAELGPKWVQLSKFFENRTDINVKSRLLLLGRRMKKTQFLNFFENDFQPVFNSSSSSSAVSNISVSNMAVNNLSVNNISVNNLSVNNLSGAISSAPQNFNKPPQPTFKAVSSAPQSFNKPPPPQLNNYYIDQNEKVQQTSFNSGFCGEKLNSYNTGFEPRINNGFAYDEQTNYNNGFEHNNGFAYNEQKSYNNSFAYEVQRQIQSISTFRTSTTVNNIPGVEVSHSSLTLEKIKPDKPSLMDGNRGVSVKREGNDGDIDEDDCGYNDNFFDTMKEIQDNEFWNDLEEPTPNLDDSDESFDVYFNL